MPRKHITLKTKLASALLALGDIPYDDAQQMTESQIISLYHFDHGILHAIDPIDDYWNLTPRLIAPHRAKSRKDISTVAKVKRVEAKWSAFTQAMRDGQKPSKKPSRWPKRKFRRGK